MDEFLQRKKKQMSNWNVSLGQWFKIPVYLHWSWLLLFGFIMISSPSFAPVYACVFILVLLHELGHSLMARHFDIPVDNITLYPIGGVAKIAPSSKPSNKQELFIAMAGPFVNLVLFPVFLILSSNDFLRILGYYNIALFVFNVIPALPMDGGRIFRSILAMTFVKNYYKATLISVRLSQVICLGFGVLGIYCGAFMLVIIAFFIASAAQGELKFAEDYNYVPHSGTDHMKHIEKRLRGMKNRNK